MERANEIKQKWEEKEKAKKNDAKDSIENMLGQWFSTIWFEINNSQVMWL